MADALAVRVEAGPVLATLESIGQRAADLTPVWESAGLKALRDMATETFKTEGAFIGEKWAKLSPTTVALKKRANRGKMGLLRMFDVLFRSLTVRSHPEQVKVVTAESLTFGTSVAYAALHQTGWATSTIFGRARKAGSDASRVSDRAGIKVVNVPARPVLPNGDLPASTRATIEAAMARFVTEGKA